MRVARTLVSCWCLLLCAAFIAACGGNSDSDSKDSNSSKSSAPKLDYPQIAPVFDADYLTAQPREQWITNGGSGYNQRYSPLDEINDSNVADLKGKWMVQLKSAIAPKHSAESQPIVYNGVMYVSTGQNDVVALNVVDGSEKWRYTGKLDPKISTVCCGWLNRGVALGDGMVFMGRLDGYLVALDQQTGEEKWRTKVVDWLKDGSGITAAPLYYDGMLYTGITGGEFGVRGRVTAFDATTGKEKWRFYTTGEGPSDPVAGKTWTGDSYLTGGAPVWQTPSIDPKLGMIYFTTGNANPDTDGSKREGDNLYAASFVALDAKTGMYKWHYQMVHHDIWDYDAPSPTVLYDAHVDGKTVPAIAEASKTGWMYSLNRETGEPIWPVKEEPVEQDAYNKTAKTQPIPQYEPFAPHDVTDEDMAKIKKTIASTPGAKGIPIVKGKMFTPPTKGKFVITKPGPAGGTNWPPSSYNPNEHLLYVCSGSGVAALNSSGTPQLEEGQFRIGSILAVLPFGNTAGRLSAIDADTGETKWKVDFPESCYSGSVTTAGNLVFVGRNDGHLEAYSADKGEKLWSFQTGAGANNTPTVFEWKGHEYVAFYAGGNSLAASPHGDYVWLFSLDGTKPELASTGPAAGMAHGGTTDGAGNATTDTPATGTQTTSAKGDAAKGESIFADNCSGCHGLSGKGGNGGPSLATVTDLARIIKQVTNGGGSMPPFKDQLNQEQINDVAAYVAQSAGKK